MTIKEKKVTFTVRVAQKKKEDLERIAKGLDRDRSFIVNEAIDSYLALQDWQHNHIVRGLNDADGRKFATNTETKRAFRM